MQQENATHVDRETARPVLRIAIPFWGSWSSTSEPEAPAKACHAEFKELLETALRAEELSRHGLTKTERRQADATRRIRDALYGQPDFA